MRAVLHARSLAQGALENVRKVDYSGSTQASAKPKPCGQPLARMGEAPPQEARTEPAEPREHTPGTGIQGDATAWEEALPQPPDTFEQSVLFTLMAQHLSNRAATASAASTATSGSGGWGSTARSSLA
ncbi:TPA: recombinase XerC, partial [Pseudomonas aeruginosa]|nr:recombinase XerC [Pseudomonas aeruginosa]